MASAETRQRLTVRAGGARVAMAADSVAEVIRTPRITRMPHGPPGLLGVTHLRGLVLPVVSLGALLGDEGHTDTTRVVVLRRDPPIGLAVDSIEALNASEGDAHADVRHGRLMLDDAGGARWFDLDVALQDRFSAFRATRRAPERETAASPTAAVAADLGFLGFTLAGQDYALPLDTVAEVMAVPKAIATLPRTEAVLLGVFELRGEIPPVVSLRALLGLEQREAQADDRVVVVRIGGHRLALLVDRISVILRASRDAVGPAPTLFNRASGEARIDSVLRLPDGRGLVSILAPERVLADERVSQLLAETSDQKDMAMASTTSATARERFLVIRLGDETYGLPIAAVDEVVRLPETLTRLPKAPAYVQGVMNLRGKVIPVIDQRQRFSVSGEAAGEARRVVVVTLDGLQAGFAVDAVARILEVEADDLMPAPELSDDGDRLFDRAAKVEREGDVILLIDPRALLERAEADLLRDLTARSPVS
ncbi:chemotaxis protein CheW [Caulobacter soli]|uniref:chemotaxis protein CheW n=1 Tax=Caulobacter soli TaxID=2708539 RepID=UPI0013EA5073|nr:chemotaxis protein CheW [Caulobacter soli]